MRCNYFVHFIFMHFDKKRSQSLPFYVEQHAVPSSDSTKKVDSDTALVFFLKYHCNKA